MVGVWVNDQKFAPRVIYSPCVLKPHLGWFSVSPQMPFAAQTDFMCLLQIVFKVLV